MTRSLLKEALRPQAAPETGTLRAMRLAMMGLCAFVCVGTFFIGFFTKLFGVGFSGIVGLAMTALAIDSWIYFGKKNAADLAFAALERSEP